MQKIIRHLFCQPHMARRIVVLILSVTIMGACVSVFDRIQFGTDPASVLNLGVANKLHMLLGTYQMLFYGALLIVVMAMRQWEFIGLGSIANMVLVGYSKDLFDVIFSSMNILNRDAMGMTERICWLVPTLGVFMVAVAFYMVVELGSGPYDAIPQIISKYVKKIPYAVIRMIYDLSAIAIGWLLGGSVGLGTILYAVAIGPLVHIFLPLFTHPILDAFTSYGTQLFWPLPVHPAMWSSLFIIDPAYTLWLLLAVIAAWWLRERRLAQQLLVASLIVSSSYLAW